MRALGPATNPPSAPSVFDNVPMRSDVGPVEVGIGAEHRVRLVEHEQRAVVRAKLGELVDRRVSPSIENTVSVTTIVRRPTRRRVVQQRVDVVDVAVAVDGDVGSRRAGSRR